MADSGAAELAAVLGGTTIVELGLEANGIGDQGAAKLTVALRARLITLGASCELAALPATKQGREPGSSRTWRTTSPPPEQGTFDPAVMQGTGGEAATDARAEAAATEPRPAGPRERKQSKLWATASIKSRSAGLFSPRKVAPNTSPNPKVAPRPPSGGVPMWTGTDQAAATTPRLPQHQFAATTPSPAGRKAPGSSSARGASARGRTPNETVPRRTPKTANAGR